jgi:hypothetical protein
MTFPAQLLSFINSQQSEVSYTTAGVSSYFTVPDGVTSLSAVCIGAGGGGAGGANDIAGGGGGGGGLSWASFSTIPGDVLEIFVGSAGAGGGVSAGNSTGSNGGDTYIRLFSRIGGGAGVGGDILIAEGGRGGAKATTTTGSGAGGAGGRGGTTTYGIPTNASVGIYTYGGGAGGNGGSCTAGGAGGGGAGGYIGVGGNGGSVNPNVVATAAQTGSGGGGGGGGTGTVGLSQRGYGGGGVGAYGIDVSGLVIDPTGSAGSNDTLDGGSGGGGGSFFNDPGLGISADFIGQTVSTTTSISYPSGIQENDFLLLMSGSDVYTGSRTLATDFATIPVPLGFTTITQSTGGVYRISSSGIATEGIPAGVADASKSYDLNFTSSYRYVPSGGLSGSLTGLTTSSVHNMFALRFLPNPPTINYLTTSGNPGLQVNTGGSLMPNPPSYVGSPKGAFSLALGYLSNVILSPGGSLAGTGTIDLNDISGGRRDRGGEGIGLVVSYAQVPSGTTTTIDPGPFLTGTTSHARAWTIEIPRSGANAVSIVGSATTGAWVDENDIVQVESQLDISGISIQNNDLVMVITAWDNPSTPSLAALTGVTFGSPGAFRSNSQANPDFDSGGMGWSITYGVWNTGDGTLITNLQSGTSNIPTAHMAIVFRNASLSQTTPNSSVFDNNTTFYGPPDPPSLTTTSNGSLVLAVGMIDNIGVSNITTVTPPEGYTTISTQSYGEQNNGAIVMSAYKNNLDPDFQAIPGTEDPGPFGGDGGNVWVAQTIIIGGPGSNTSGGPNNAGQWGGGGGSGRDNQSVTGMAGAQGAARIIWGTARQYPTSSTVANTPLAVDWTP